MFPNFPQVAIKGGARDLADMSRGRQDGAVHEVRAPGPGEEVLLLPLGGIVEHRGQVDGGGENVPEVIVGVEDNLVPVNVVPGHVGVVVYLGHAHTRTRGADVVFPIPETWTRV